MQSSSNRMKVAVIGPGPLVFRLLDHQSPDSNRRCRAVFGVGSRPRPGHGARGSARAPRSSPTTSSRRPRIRTLMLPSSRRQPRSMPGLTVAALRSGKHVLCNKPMAMTIAECDQMNNEAAKAKGKLLILNGTWRYWPLSLRAREIVQSGEIGEVLTARFWTRAPLPQEAPGAGSPGWFADSTRAAGGAFIDHGIYQFDLLEWMLGSVIAHVDSISLLNVKYKDLKFRGLRPGVVAAPEWGRCGRRGIMDQPHIQHGMGDHGNEGRADRGYRKQAHDVAADGFGRPTAVLRSGRPRRKSERVHRLLQLPERGCGAASVWRRGGPVDGDVPRQIARGCVGRK